METGVEAIVLAAGASTRLGRPKALLDFGGTTALERVLGALREAGVRRGVVVTGAADEAMRDAVDPAPLAWVRNPAPEAGRTGSVQTGFRAIDAAAGAVLWPVDRPLASPRTVQALLAARAKAPGAVIVPEAEGRRGHPLILPAAVRDAVLAAAPDASLRNVLRGAGAERRVVPVDDPGIHFDLDTEEAYARALAWWRARANPQSG